MVSEPGGVGDLQKECDKDAAASSESSGETGKLADWTCLIAVAEKDSGGGGGFVVGNVEDW